MVEYDDDGEDYGVNKQRLIILIAIISFLIFATFAIIIVVFGSSFGFIEPASVTISQIDEFTIDNSLINNAAGAVDDLLSGIGLDIGISKNYADDVMFAVTAKGAQGKIVNADIIVNLKDSSSGNIIDVQHAYVQNLPVGNTQTVKVTLTGSKEVTKYNVFTEYSANYAN